MVLKYFWCFDFQKMKKSFRLFLVAMVIASQISLLMAQGGSFNPINAPMRGKRIQQV